jgi:sugar transferase (PEP-CTERM/EpsH1 system associated)
MNILFVANRFPYPPYRGDKLKIYNIARRLSKRHRLFLITFIQDENDLKYVKELDKIFMKCIFVKLSKFRSGINCLLHLFSGKPVQVSYFMSHDLDRKLENFIENNKIDVIHTQHLRMAQFTSKISSVKKILDLPDAYSLYWKRRQKESKKIFSKIFAYIEYRKVLNYERILNKFDLNLVCSPEDMEYLKEHHRINNIDILPNGVDLDYFYSNGSLRIKNKIIFSGNMDYSPNVDAAIYFTKEIFPEILKKFPDAKFYIAGQKPVKAVKNLQSENVIVTGFLKDLRHEYESSSVAVSPIRFGAGTLNKVLEPMSVGTPVVTSEIGFKGLGVKNGEGVLLARNKSEFIENISKLLSSSSYIQKIGNKGISVIRDRFDWNTIVNSLEKYMIELISDNQQDPGVNTIPQKNLQKPEYKHSNRKKIKRKYKEGEIS